MPNELTHLASYFAFVHTVGMAVGLLVIFYDAGGVGRGVTGIERLASVVNHLIPLPRTAMLIATGVVAFLLLWAWPVATLLYALTPRRAH